MMGKIWTWWRHQMETFPALLVLCAGNSLVTGEFPSQRPVTRSFDVFFNLRLNKRMSKQSWSWWFETTSRSLWRHCNGSVILFFNISFQNMAAIDGWSKISMKEKYAHERWVNISSSPLFIGHSTWNQHWNPEYVILTFHRWLLLRCIHIDKNSVKITFPLSERLCVESTSSWYHSK